MSDFRNRVRNSAYSNVSVHDEDEMDRSEYLIGLGVELRDLAYKTVVCAYVFSAVAARCMG